MNRSGMAGDSADTCLNTFLAYDKARIIEVVKDCSDYVAASVIQGV